MIRPLAFLVPASCKPAIPKRKDYARRDMANNGLASSAMHPLLILSPLLGKEMRKTRQNNPHHTGANGSRPREFAYLRTGTDIKAYPLKKRYSQWVKGMNRSLEQMNDRPSSFGT
jgi:hypothetical protein